MLMYQKMRKEKKTKKQNQLHRLHNPHQVKAGNMVEYKMKKNTVEKMLIRSENKKIYFPQPQKFQTII